MEPEGRPAVDLRTDIAHAARVYDFVLGGKTNYPADREAAKKIMASLPTVQRDARANRSFLIRAVRHLAGEGLRQFLDIGTGIPTSPNVHEAVQEIAPECRVVYADKDPIVLAHSRALHTSTPQGRTAYIQADASDPDAILTAPALRETLDLSKPVVLSMVLLLHWLPVDPYPVVRRLLDELAPGSFLVITYLASDLNTGVNGLVDTFVQQGTDLKSRPKADVLRFFEGTELVAPGLVPCDQWRPAVSGRIEVGSPANGTGTGVPVWAGVGVKR
jgi:SAM-dependent methyltransferase